MNVFCVDLALKRHADHRTTKNLLSRGKSSACNNEIPILTQIERGRITVNSLRTKWWIDFNAGNNPRFPLNWTGYTLL